LTLAKSTPPPLHLQGKGNQTMTPPANNARLELEERLRFETLIAELSSKFVNLPAHDVDCEIQDAQRRVCECLGLELSALWQWSGNEPDVLTMTHLYRPLGGPPVPEQMKAAAYFPWAKKEVRAGRVIKFDSLEESPPEAARDLEAWRHYGLKNVLVIPLSAGGGPPFGCVSFHNVRAERAWTEEITSRLMLVAQVFANSLARKVADLALRESEARLSLAAESAGAGLWILDVASSRLWLTPKNRELFEFTPDEEITFERVIRRVHPEDREPLRSIVAEVLRTRREGGVEYRIVLPDGKVRWMASRGRPHGGGDEPLRLMGVTVDVTERKRFEEELQRSCAEIERLKNQLQAESDYLKAELRTVQPHAGIVGQSAGIKRVLREVEQVAPTDSSVLIFGETGTGKERIAEAVHRLSPRKNRVLVKVNCAALPSALVESELFGREKGAFTGALTRQIGRFEVADGSTIFLDEIGDLSPEIQAKLLRVLQEGQFERLGSPRTIKVNVRVIVATNRVLADEVRKGRFREDLFYRLNVFPIHLPPLRERVDDIPLLVWAFVREFSARMGRKLTKIPRNTMEALSRHPWPGNVRELRNVIERGVIISRGEVLRIPALEYVLPAVPIVQTLAEGQHDHILKALEKTGWRIKGPKGAARMLGIKPSTLYTRMKKLGVPHHRQKDGSPT